MPAVQHQIVPLAEADRALTALYSAITLPIQPVAVYVILRLICIFSSLLAFTYIVLVTLFLPKQLPSSQQPAQYQPNLYMQTTVIPKRKSADRAETIRGMEIVVVCPLAY